MFQNLVDEVLEVGFFSDVYLGDVDSYDVDGIECGEILRDDGGGSLTR